MGLRKESPSEIVLGRQAEGLKEGGIVIFSI